MSYARHLLALLLLALAVCACGDPGQGDRVGGGQTGGEGKAGDPCAPGHPVTIVGPDTVGPTGLSSAQALVRFGVEHTALGMVSERPNTTLHSALSYGGESRVECKRLVVVVSATLRTADGSFDEVVDGELHVYAPDDASFFATHSTDALRGSYRELLPAGDAREVYVQLNFEPELSGWVSLAPARSGQPNTVLAKF